MNAATATAAAALLAATLPTLAQSVSVDFNTPGQLANNFNTYQNATPGAGSPYTQTPIGGIGNGGAVAVLPPGTTVTADSTAIYKSQSFDFSAAGATLTISEYVNIIPVNGGGNRLLQLGFVNENTSGLNNNTGLAFMSLRLSTVGTSGNTYTPAFQDKTASGSVVNTTLSPNVTLTAGDWYELSGQFVNLGGGKFQVSGLLQDYGPTGQSSPATAFTFAPQSFSNADVTSDAAVWAAFRSFHNDGANALDNFTAQAVPEPGTSAMCLTGLVGLGCALRRRLIS
jgi:hypothetical protein